MAPRLLIGLVLALSLVVAVPATALAECSAWAEPAPPSLRYAFTATVMDASGDADPESRDEWHLDLSIDDVYRGRLPDRISYNGHDVGCHALRGDRLTTGQRIFVVANVVDIREDGGDPFGGIRPQVMAWRWTGDAWAFYDEVLDPSQNDQVFPQAAREATTTAAILDFFDSLPETSMAPRSEPIPVIQLVALVSVFALAFVAARRPGRPRI